MRKLAKSTIGQTCYWMQQNEEYQDSFLKMSFQVSKMVGSGVITVPDPITKLAKWQ